MRLGSRGLSGRWRVAEPVALAALVLDAAFGWPAGLYRRIGHPVGAFAAVLDRVEAQWNRPERSEMLRQLAGVMTMVILVGGTVAVAVGLQWIAQAVFGRWWWIAVAVLAWPALAMRSLSDHVLAVAEAGELPAARHAVGMIVGRDTGSLDEAGVARAGIESLAESFCDGVVAPLFWLLVAGLPGVWAYKAINTADSMIGHREERWRAFGWAAARVDDVANWVPARIAGVLVCLAGAGGWGVMWRDCRKHASPNAGWPEAAMAGVLRVALAGPVVYDGVVANKFWIGREGAVASSGDLRRALHVYWRACGLLIVLAGVIAWLR